jgi:hypothetical protein
MKEKKDIVENWLPRYTGTPVCTENLIGVDEVMESPKLAE